MLEETLWLAVAATLSLAGMAWLALTIDTHWEQVMRRPATTDLKRRVLQVLGGGALLLSLLACLVADRPPMAILVWVMLLTAAAAVVAQMLAWRAHWLRPLALWFVG